MFPFDVILFDVGGVLLTNGWDQRERAEVLERFGVDVPAFEARHSLIYNSWERGEIPLVTYLDATVFREPRGFSRDEFFAAMCAQSAPLKDGALGIAAELAASKNYLLGTLNNEARETNGYRFEKFRLRALFEVAFSSCYLGLRKPDAAIYKRALDILGRPPERVLFIDDRAENVAAAQAVGMKAIVFQGQDELRRKLVSLEVL